MNTNGDKRCTTVWIEWENYCSGYRYDVCIAVATAFFEEFYSPDMVSMQKTKNATFRNKIMASKKIAQTALLGKTEATQQEESGFDYSGVIMATSFTVLGAVAAAVAIKKCAGKRQEQQDHFERIV